jgi:serine/threonine protein kinase
MEYCELGDLQSYLSSNPPLPEPESQEVMFQILDGIRYMHEHEFAHRDMKPAVRPQMSLFHGIRRLTKLYKFRTSSLKLCHQNPGGSRLQISVSASV